MRLEQAQLEELPTYDRGGDIEALRQTCLQETGLKPPAPQWETDLYGPHCALKYVKDWYEEMKVQKGWRLE
jgi:5-oxoprolinase (ATP-hydrolysing)